MNKQKNSGFTLIEIMIAMVIVSILAMIAIPAYQDSVTKARRSDGHAILLNIMNAQERYYTENNTYTADLTDIDYATATNVDSDENFYKVTAAACAGSTIGACVNLTATAQTAQLADGNLTLDSRNVKTPASKW